MRTEGGSDHHGLFVSQPNRYRTSSLETVTVWFSRGMASTFHALRLIREGDAKRRVRLMCSHSNPHFSGFTVADVSFREPSGLSGEQYVNWCLQRCSEGRVDVLVPGRDRPLFASVAEAFQAVGTRIWLPANAATLDFFQDKARFYAEFPSEIVPVPDAVAVTTADEYRAAMALMSARHNALCIKPSRSVFGIGFRRLDSTLTLIHTLIADCSYRIHPDELERILASVDRFPVMLVMEFLDGSEWSVDCAALNGVLIGAVVRKKLNFPGNVQMVDQRAAFLEIARQLTRTYRLTGMFNFQLREGNGRVAILEVNTRMSGGIGLACASGVNLPWLALQACLDSSPPASVQEAQDGMLIAEAYLPVEITAGVVG